MAGEIQLNSTTFATESSGTITLSNVDSATNRQNLGLEIGVDVQQHDADTTKNDVANTFTANQIISVTDNTNAALRVTQLGTGNALVVEDSANPDSSPFVITSSGQLLIGNTNAAANMAASSVLISNDGTASFAVNTSADDLVIDRETGGITIYGHTGAGSGRIAFGTATNNAIGSVVYQHTDNSMRFNVNGAERMRIDSSGRFIVGSITAVTTNVAGVMLSRVGTQGRIEIGSTSTSAQDLAYFINPNGIVGSIQTSGTSTTYSTSSDYRLKENITEITDGINRVKQLNPSRFNFIADPDKIVDGFIAHEIQGIVPEAVSGEKDVVDLDGNPKYQGVDYGRITPLLTAALKEAIEKIEMLEARIAVLEAK